MLTFRFPPASRAEQPRFNFPQKSLLADLTLSENLGLFGVKCWECWHGQTGVTQSSEVHGQTAGNNGHSSPSLFPDMASGSLTWSALETLKSLKLNFIPTRWCLSSRFYSFCRCMSMRNFCSLVISLPMEHLHSFVWNIKQQGGDAFCIGDKLSGCALVSCLM